MSDRERAESFEEVGLQVASAVEEWRTGLVETLDEMQPYPVAGKFFGELILRGEVATEAGIFIRPEERDNDLVEIRPKRARVLQLGAPPEGGWTVEVGDEVLLPYHAGTVYLWFNQKGIEESLFIIDHNEIIAVFKPKEKR